MVASIGKIVSAAQGVSYYERDGYYARGDPAHREASAWAGKGSQALGLSGPVDPETFTAILEGRVPDGSQLGRRDRDGNVHRATHHGAVEGGGSARQHRADGPKVRLFAAFST